VAEPNPQTGRTGDISRAPVGWGNIVKFYSQRRLLTIFLLGMASGYPWVMIGSSMTAWLNEMGFTRATIGFFGAVFAAYSVNFLWSPLVDRIKIPILSDWLGHRRGWILFCQMGVAAACFVLAQIDFTESLRLAGIVALTIAIFSATQDIAIDAYRIDSVGEHEARVQSAAAAMATAGWWTGFAGLGALPFFLTDTSTSTTFAFLLQGMAWPEVYQILAAMMLLLSAGVWLAQEPKTSRGAQQREAELHYQQAAAAEPKRMLALMALAIGLLGLVIAAFSGAVAHLNAALSGLPGIVGWLMWMVLFALVLYPLAKILLHFNRETPPAQKHMQSLRIGISHRTTAWLVVTLVEPLAEFFRRNGPRFALSILLFVLLFKVGEAFLGRMSIVFYQEVGFTNAEIGLYSKLVNWWVTIAFALIGSYVTMRIGILKGLFIGGSAMAASNLLFSALALVGPNKALLLAAVITDGFTSAWSTVAFVALISLLANRAFTATQYALMASIGTLGRTVLAAYSGVVVDWLNGNWALFFLLTTVMVIPSLLFLWAIRRDVQKLEDDNRARQAAWDRENGELP